MSYRLSIMAAPGPLEDFAAAFDDLLDRRSQREAFRRYLEGILLPSERNKTLTALPNTEPISGATKPQVQKLQRAWSEKAPPEPLQALLDWLWTGRPIYLYGR